MTSDKTCLILFISAALTLSACHTKTILKEEDKLLHAGPVNSGFGVIFFGLFKDNKYQFCDGDFMDYGCYTGDYSLAGDTITLHDLKEHKGIPSNRFIIRRYRDMDSNYWKWKYPKLKGDWENLRSSDSARGSTGDIFPLTSKGEIVLDPNSYFLIRLDKLDGK